MKRGYEALNVVSEWVSEWVGGWVSEWVSECLTSSVQLSAI
jgi:hypothetical protein